MSPIPDDFEQLRRLLALKRHETPPPGYFHGFSRQVIVRIQAGEIGEPVEAAGWSFSGGSFLQRIWATLDARPAMAGAFGVAVCGFFVVGALLSENTSTVNANQLPLTASSVWQPKADTDVSSLGGDLPAYPPTYQPPADSLFDQIRKAQAPRHLSPHSGIPAPVRVSYPAP